ncbi:MAG: DNA polymerase Y family protein [Litoreibacter sp.]|nr:DNA polymerase Y family protein [Litoreibacter sp.]
MQKRVVSVWCPTLPSDRALRARSTDSDAPFALTHLHKSANRIYCLNRAARAQGLHPGMPHADAHAFCPDLISQPADLPGDARFQQMLARWATRYCPWIGLEGPHGLVLDVTGSTHLWPDEATMLGDMKQRLSRAGIHALIGIADTRGASWALALHGGGIAQPGQTEARIARLPVSALRIAEKTCVSLERLGLRTIADLIALPRPTVTRRFGAEVLLRLDQALGAQPESISPLSDPPHYGVRMTLPEPIGLTSDVMAGTQRLLTRLCETLKEQEVGARVLQLTLRRVDQDSQQVELRLARPLRDAGRILPLFERGVGEVEAGFGIDMMRLEATQVEPLPVKQVTHIAGRDKDKLDDLITRIGTRIGLENVQRFLPADSHIPERSFTIAAAAFSEPEGSWVALHPRPLKLFTPEPIAGHGNRPPKSFRWRNMSLSTGRATGPERIAPEWWMADENWRAGLRDYWRVETRQGRRLWLFHTPQNPGWFVQGEFA